MIAKATDQNDVETPGVSGESIKSKQDFTEAQCDRFYKAIVTKLLLAQPDCKCEMFVKTANKLPANAVIEPYYDAERQVVGLRVRAEQIKQKRGKVKRKKILHNTGLVRPDGRKLTSQNGQEQ